MREDNIRKELDKEIYFKDPSKEYEYFQERKQIISKYEKGPLKNYAINSLIRRYLRAIAAFEDNYEADAFIQVYKDCLIELGADDYSIKEEVENYKQTHILKEKDKFVSEQARSPKNKRWLLFSSKKINKSI